MGINPYQHLGKLNIIVLMIMSDALILKSVIDLMDAQTDIVWSNKYICPEGYSYNEDGYVITREPRPIIRSCIGFSFGFLVKKLGVEEYLFQNAVALRLLNPNCYKTSVSIALWRALVKSGFFVDKPVFDAAVDRAYALTERPDNMDRNFFNWRVTWFSSTCPYDTVSKVVKQDNSCRIDSDRELMTIDKKYITKEVADFTGFSIRRIDRYWSDKEWNKKLRTLYTVEEAVASLTKLGINNPTRKQIAEVSGLAVDTISRLMIDIKKMISNNMLAIDAGDNENDNEEC